MKKLLLLCSLIGYIKSSAQVPLQSVVEHFTNTKCPPCASRNPGLYSNIGSFPDIQHLSIHPSSPYKACILSQQNTKDNDDRTNHYGIYGSTPRIVVNGNVVPNTTDYSKSEVLNPYSGLSSPIAMHIEQFNYGTDSIVCKLSIKKVAATSSTNASLFVGILEDTVFVDGGNGEPEHYDVLRRSLSGEEEINIPLSFPVGDSVVLSLGSKTESFWDIKRMFCTALLFDAGSRQLIQSTHNTAAEASMGISDPIPDPQQFTIYPNPANTHIYIKHSQNKKIQLHISNSIGQLIIQTESLPGEAISLSGLRSGLYILRISNGEYTDTRKLIIQR